MQCCEALLLTACLVLPTGELGGWVGAGGGEDCTCFTGLCCCASYVLGPERDCDVCVSLTLLKDMHDVCSLPLLPGLLVTAQNDCALSFYIFGNRQDRVVFTGLTAEEKAMSGNNTSGHRLTCACTSVEGLTPLQWLDVNGMVLPEDRSRSLIDYKTTNRQPGSAVHLRINKAGFSCAEAGKYTCVVGNNTRSVLVTPIGECSKQCVDRRP